MIPTEIKRPGGTPVKIFAETVEYEALDQIKRLANYPAYIRSTIRVMPDCHAGKGCTIGTTMTLTDSVTPNLVGVDIGCGMLCIKLKDTDIDLQKLDEVIHRYVPAGFDIHEQPWVKTDMLDELLCFSSVDTDRAIKSLGTLGGGNHFIELDKSERNGYFYLVIHTGSRHLGVQVAKFYQDLAVKKLNEMGQVKKDLIDRLKAEGREKDIQTELKKLQKPACCKELAHLTGSDFNNYLHDMEICQKYASLNRRTIADIILKKMNLRGNSSFETVHNYIDTKNMILRKGAVSAQDGEVLIIPMNMRDGSLICVGKGNPDWNCSAPHGAGRLMSRSKAKEQVSMDDYRESMQGIYTTTVCEGTLDESPMAYKPVEEIKRCIQDTVAITEIIKPVYNFKAAE